MLLFACVSHLHGSIHDSRFTCSILCVAPQVLHGWMRWDRNQCGALCVCEINFNDSASGACHASKLARTSTHREARIGQTHETTRNDAHIGAVPTCTCHVMSYRIISHHHHIPSHPIPSHHVTSHRITSHHITHHVIRVTPTDMVRFICRCMCVCVCVCIKSRLKREHRSLAAHNTP